jgi:hypothetical protein
LDSTGHLVLGEPGAPSKKPSLSKAQTSTATIDFNLAETWNNIPMPLKLGVPAVLVLLLALRIFWPQGGAADFQAGGDALLRALVANDRSRAVSYATADTREAAGQWFDLMRQEIETAKIGQDVFINISLYSGNADKDNAIVLNAIVTSGAGSDGATPPMFLHMKREGGRWALDGKSTLAEAEKSASASDGSKSSRK